MTWILIVWLHSASGAAINTTSVETEVLCKQAIKDIEKDGYTLRAMCVKVKNEY